MASKEMQWEFIQTPDYVSVCTKADPEVKEYSVFFGNNGFIVYADG